MSDGTNNNQDMRSQLAAIRPYVKQTEKPFNPLEDIEMNSTEGKLNVKTPTGNVSININQEDAKKILDNTIRLQEAAAWEKRAAMFSNIGLGMMMMGAAVATVVGFFRATSQPK